MMDSTWRPPTLYDRATMSAIQCVGHTKAGVLVFTLGDVTYYAYPVHRDLVACSASCIVGDAFAWQTHPRSITAEAYLGCLLVLSGSGPRQRTFMQFGQQRTINEFYIGVKALKKLGVAFVPWRNM